MKEVLIGKEDNGIKLILYGNGDLKIEELFETNNMKGGEVYLISDETLILKDTSINIYNERKIDW